MVKWLKKIPAKKPKVEDNTKQEPWIYLTRHTYTEIRCDILEWMKEGVCHYQLSSNQGSHTILKSMWQWLSDTAQMRVPGSIHTLNISGV